jgi:PIN domain nuclease of toxin-antitoxin system
LRRSSVVFDASALLAYIRDEPGAAIVGEAVGGAAISAANWAEVMEKSLLAGLDAGALRSDVEAFGVRVAPVEVEQAEFAARLREPTRSLGLSLADRLCFALAADLQAPILTADRQWSKVEAGVEVRVIR